MGAETEGLPVLKTEEIKVTGIPEPLRPQIADMLNGGAEGMVLMGNLPNALILRALATAVLKGDDDG
ncbi:hypothetical protein SEA_RASPUTIA_141 [Microbacterium phage Rasputia]|nr:hypothetical protein SEA_RASPUTIA_141 [Microbacterium phage Rasputia]